MKLYYLGKDKKGTVYAQFTGGYPGNFPQIKLYHSQYSPAYGGKPFAKFSGSSISRANPGCLPDEGDIAYWRSLAKVIEPSEGIIEVPVPERNLVLIDESGKFFAACVECATVHVIETGQAKDTGKRTFKDCQCSRCEKERRNKAE